MSRAVSAHRVRFQSTRPVRGATVIRKIPNTCVWGFNPRAPCGARLVGGDSFALFRRFQSTRPVRGATVCRSSSAHSFPVSIHAPRAGRDAARVHSHRFKCSFNPRAPCGARQRIRVRSSLTRRFNPRAPCGARLVPSQACSIPPCFNPRAPCGARRSSRSDISAILSFNPRAPCGARRRNTYHSALYVGFNPRAPCGARRF